MRKEISGMAGKGSKPSKATKTPKASGSKSKGGAKKK
jgi:hypothetical protein